MTATEKHAALCLHTGPYSSCLRKAVVNIQISVAPLKRFEHRTIFVVSSRKLPSHKTLQYINIYAQMILQQQREDMVYVICTCLYVHTCNVIRNVTISSTMRILCYELRHTLLFIINILYILYPGCFIEECMAPYTIHSDLCFF